MRAWFYYKQATNGVLLNDVTGCKNLQFVESLGYIKMLKNLEQKRLVFKSKM